MPFRPPVDKTQEVRFAAVMYGGVSLAIYINGVAQELLRLVRATAPGPGGNALIPTEELRPVERVYRELGQLLPVENGATSVPQTAPIRTQFVVDILSGTSAGGINAVFLSKALANGLDLDGLRRLWLGEADIGLLLNDRDSVKGTPLRAQPAPQSLLNSQRMYLKLLNALDDMGGLAAAAPLVDNLDLYVTATDIQGVNVPIRLHDLVVEERRHRNVFHFRFTGDDGKNDFSDADNPFLAFAARCTSAFPFAFEPMRLSDVQEALERQDQPDRLRLESWERFFEAYLRGEAAGAPEERRKVYYHRAFGDGGYLDNKPFSYAVDALMLRSGGVAVDRKLIYIEPAPEIPQPDRTPEEKPDFVENVLAALLTLPRYETIREDLERVKGRNRLVERLQRILANIEEDVRYSRRTGGEDPTYPEMDLREMIQAKGVAYGGYHRLKVKAISDEIARMLTRAAGLDDESDEFAAIRTLVAWWRDQRYVEYKPKKGPPQETQNRFLMDYDLSYRLRRLSFVRRKIDELAALDDNARRIFRSVGGRAFLRDLPADGAGRREFRDELWKAIKPELHQVHLKLWRKRESLLERRDKNPLHPFVGKVGLTAQQLRTLIAHPSTAEAEKILKNQIALWNEAAKALAAQLRGVMVAASSQVRFVLEMLPGLSPVRQAVRHCVHHFYTSYDDYDLITFPILYTSGASAIEELDTVEIIRISPEDATAVIDEKQERQRADGRRKLAGTVLANFGGFLERPWRENDMLWGRLDAAERLISALLPGDPHRELRRSFVDRALEAILREVADEILGPAEPPPRTEPFPDYVRRMWKSYRSKEGR